MNDETKPKKGFIALIRESLKKTGGCCGAGETCGTPPKDNEKEPSKESKKPAENHFKKCCCAAVAMVRVVGPTEEDTRPGARI